MIQYRFEWDRTKAARNAEKHGVTFEEAQTVFYDVFALHQYDGEHSVDEERFIIIGMSERERVLFVAYCERTQLTVRLISARHATPGEKRVYEEETRR